MFLIADRAADICEQLVGATVVKGEKITFEQTLQEKISECISVSWIANYINFLPFYYI